MLVLISSIIWLCLDNVRSLEESTAKDLNDCNTEWDVESDLGDMPEVSLLQTHMSLSDRSRLDASHESKAAQLADERREKKANAATSQPSSDILYRQASGYDGFDGELFVQRCHWVVLVCICCFGLILAVAHYKSKSDTVFGMKSAGLLIWARRGKKQADIESIESPIKAEVSSEEKAEDGQLLATQPEEELDTANVLEAQPEEEPEAHNSDDERMELLFDRVMEVVADEIVTSVALSEAEDSVTLCTATTTDQFLSERSLLPQ
jgi:hypothetical protein|mmetsp:Transcript_116759/g.183601  ORF Transcript_116759/g.183601 Transcript_116759/m.183601 type:complete len:264 (-) Transcript_116759:126-917(-)